MSVYNSLMDNIWSKYYKDSILSHIDSGFDEEQTIYEAFRQSCEEHKNLVALEHGKTKISYAELLTHTDTLAAAFKSIGIIKGDAVALCVNGIPATVFTVYAASKLGVSVVMFNSKLGAEGFKRLCIEMNVKAAVMTADLLSSCVTILADTPLEKVVVCRYGDYFTFADKLRTSVHKLTVMDSVKIGKLDIPSEIAVYRFMELMAEHEGDDMSYEGGISSESEAICFANASATGKAMIASLSSRAINAQSHMDSFLLGEEHSRVLCFIDRSYSCGFCLGVHSVLLSGHTLLLYAGDVSRVPKKGFSGYKPDVFIGYPSLIVNIIQKLSTIRFNISYLKKVIACGAVMNAGQKYELDSFLKSRNPKTVVEKVYGMDETGAVYIYNQPELKNSRIFGIPLPGVLIKIMDAESEREMNPGEMGQICVCTPSAMTGYRADDGSSENVLRRFKDGRNWVLTGDLGHADENGLIYFDGNSKNIFERGSVIVYPYLIEESIIAVDGVKEVCVVDTERYGEPYITAVIVPEDEYLFDGDKLDALKLAIESECELILAPSMRPDDFEFRAYLPKAILGRNDHDALRKQLMEKYIKLDEEEYPEEDFDEILN